MKPPKPRNPWLTALAVVLVALGLTVVGFFVFIAIAMQSYGSNK